MASLQSRINGQADLFIRYDDPLLVIGQINSTYKMGDQDQFISSFNTNGKFKYTLNGACGVKFQDRIHFFGGWNHPEERFQIDARDFIQFM